MVILNSCLCSIGAQHVSWAYAGLGVGQDSEISLTDIKRTQNRGGEKRG